MTADQKAASLGRRVAELIAIEDHVADLLARAGHLSQDDPGPLGAVMQLQPLAARRHDRLVEYLRDAGGRDPGRKAQAPRRSTGQPAELPDVWRDLCLAFQEGALGYAMLYEVALRLYEPRLRELAPQHLSDCADAALSTSILLPGVVARHLASEGHEHCTCLCPMCRLGACGCVAVGTEAMKSALHRTAPVTAGPPGFVLLPPRPHSALALAGARGGDILLAVEGQPVRSTIEIQAELRKRQLGDDVTLLIRRGSDAPREITVRHAGDHPMSQGVPASGASGLASNRQAPPSRSRR